ncbi:MAG TPA: ABC-F family ATP-binding cassette domain-containing protein [Fimbriimonas sp.]
MLLSVSNVAKSFGVDQVLDGVTFRIEPREKVALVGRNGTGKTTLLKIITGQMEADRGGIQLSRGAKVGYLRQEAPVGYGHTVLDEAEAALERQIELRGRLEELERRMESGSASPEDLEEYALVHEHFIEAEGYSAEQDLKTVLQRMGFSEEEFGRPTNELSGGQKTRLAIARLLLEEPDLLILDEPTNHLDLQATEWLEGWIRQYHGAILLVSHDRAFLDNTAERVLELRDGTVKAYPGPFAKYLRLKAEDEARQAEMARRQEQEMAKLDEFVRRFMNSQRTAQARGRLKMLNRMQENRIQAPKKDPGMAAGFTSAKRSGDVSFECERLLFGHDKVLLPELGWTVRYGERWGVIGENGAGKSTLIKTILGRLEPKGGRVRIGSGVTIGYFSQDTEDLDPEDSPLDALVWDLDMDPPDARNLLGRFLITGDDVFRPIKTLSGGEKNKLSLAKLTRLNPNLLVLDEPTNHLDMDSREALAAVLKDYQGTLVLISHDRWLLGEVADQTLDVRRSGAIAYPGTYEEYRSRTARPTPSKTVAAAKVEATPELTPRELSKEIGRLVKAVADLEQEIGEKENALAALEAQLANLDPAADVLSLTMDHQRQQEQLAGMLAAWEEQSLRLEELREKQG